MEHQSTILVVQIFSTTLHTRDAANHLFQMVVSNSCDTVELDFANVEFISRSFADQFHNDKLEAKAKHNKKIAIVNAGEMVTNMLEAVAGTQGNSIRKQEKIPVIQLSSMTELDDFLRSI